MSAKNMDEYVAQTYFDAQLSESAKELHLMFGNQLGESDKETSL